MRSTRSGSEASVGRATLRRSRHHGAALSTWEFLASFGSFLVVLLYVLVPWTSVNLVDYYFVRRGRYASAEADEFGVRSVSFDQAAR